ncbi:hypothetical protein A6A19_03435 [Actinobacillus delphinicola]|uniref:glycosyltransferase family 9 protein n=1 Tax=Actinobacillus delphinicola TaxID=51161 RepID=UPI0024425CA9|nr:glycosyltransferase family 9 protein [Actinobacillus delphinicola]MDG6897076.1 hypothetical protein [Actinobacillus delphinicola]
MQLKVLLKKFRLKLGKILLDKKMSDNSVSSDSSRFLFLRQDGKIGDILVSSFVFRELKKVYPNCYICVVCTAKNRYLLESNTYIDELVEINKRSILDRIKTGLKLRRQFFDVVVDLSYILRNRDLLFIRLIGATNNIGFLKGNYKIFNINLLNANDHTSILYKALLHSLGVMEVNSQYDVPINLIFKENILNFLQKKHLENYICLNFFGAGRDRQFNEYNQKALLRYLLENTDRKIVLLTFPGVTEELQQIISVLHAEDRVFMYSDTKNILESSVLIENAALVITADTCVVHFAAAFKKPLIAFYVDHPEEFVRWHPNNLAETHIFKCKDNINNIDFHQIDPLWLN